MFNHNYVVPVSRIAHGIMASMLFVMGYAILTI